MRGSGKNAGVIEGNADHAGQDHERREEHLRYRGDKRCEAGCMDRARRQRTLHDEEIGAPVAEGQHEAETHGETEPFDAQRIVTRAREVAPALCPGTRRVAVRGGHAIELRLERCPSTDRLQSDDDERREAGHDEKELQYLVVDC